jgi:acyl carrier protein
MNHVNVASLKDEIKDLIIEALSIQHVKPEEINTNAPLFARDNILGLDSIDAIEIVMAVQRKYNVRIADQNLARAVLESIDTIADFVAKELAHAE